MVGCLSSQWSIDFFAGIYVSVSFGVICFSPDSMQNWLCAAWKDVSSSSFGVAWRSPPMRMVIVGNLNMISVCIHVSISAYIVSGAFVRCYGIYADIVLIGEPSCGVSLAANM